MLDDFVYNNPELYELVFPARGKSDLCVRVFQEHLSEAPRSVLDVGCGTGRDLAELSKLYPDCVGFDITSAMVVHARKRYPGLTVFVDDMRSCRLGRTFDAICALGGCINFALSNEELQQTIRTYVAHAHEGTLLLLQPLNPCDFFGEFRLPKTFSVPYKGSEAIGTATYRLAKIEQLVERTRTWRVEAGGGEFADSITFRVTFPAELSYFLGQNGFEVLEIFETPGSAAYATQAMYLVARFTG